MVLGRKMNIHDNFVFLNRLHQDCSPNQYIRELTINAIQGIMRTAEKKGEVVWDIDWQFYEEGAPKKLCIYDTGDGIEPENMESFLNQLSSGIQSRESDGDTNYGVGGKIAALPKNQAGLMYQSWTNGNPVGHSITLGLDDDNSYGLLPIDGNFSLKISIKEAPDAIQLAGRGTKVTLYGNDELEDTMVPSGKGGAKWLSKYLNSKIYSMPDGIKLRSREWIDGHPPRERGNSASPNFLRLISGMKHFLEAHKEESGEMRLEKGVVEDGTTIKATAYWWVLDENAPKSASGYTQSNGHVALLFDNNSITEIYEPRYQHFALLRFGVIHHHRRVVIYIKPDPIPGLSATIGRDRLKYKSYDLPWDLWEQEFAENLPEAIKKLHRQDENQSDIRDKLRNYHEFLNSMPTYATINKLLEQEVLVEKNAQGPYVREGDVIHDPDKPGKTFKTRRRKKWGIERILEKVEVSETPSNMTIVNEEDIPKVQWYSMVEHPELNVQYVEDDDGSLSFNDRMAQYLPGPNLIRANFDFRGFRHFVNIMVADNNRSAEIEIITRMIMEAYEIVLIECVLGIKSLSKSANTWPREDLANALSAEALTAAVMQRYHIHQVLKRNVNHRLGKAHVAT